MLAAANSAAVAAGEREGLGMVDGPSDDSLGKAYGERGRLAVDGTNILPAHEWSRPSTAVLYNQGPRVGLGCHTQVRGTSLSSCLLV